ncbi:protein FAM131B isoform X4 [Saccopteryx bilineata]|uniref:protein FAM131B isoform X4 n=1 Tax=Saccopteryx bilineata TaxID=59482 RepID=UPI00338E0E3F
MGGRVTRRRTGRRTPWRAWLPSASLRLLPVGGSPRLTAGWSVCTASRVAAWTPGPRTLRPGPKPPLARRGRDAGQREEGVGGESAAPRPYKERPGEGAGRGGEGGRGRKLPQEGAQVLPRGRRLRHGPPAPAPAAPARRGPPLPEHRPLMSFPDLLPPTPTPDPRCPRPDAPSPLRDMPAGVRWVPPGCRSRLFATPPRPSPLLSGPAVTCPSHLQLLLHLPTQLPASGSISTPGRPVVATSSRVDRDAGCLCHECLTPPSACVAMHDINHSVQNFSDRYHQTGIPSS